MIDGLTAVQSAMENPLLSRETEQKEQAPMQNLNHLLGPEVICSQLGIIDLHHQSGIFRLGTQDLGNERLLGED